MDYPVWKIQKLAQVHKVQKIKQKIVTKSTMMRMRENCDVTQRWVVKDSILFK